MLRDEDTRSEHHFFDIYLTTFSGVHNFKNTSAMRVNFFLKMLQIESKFPKSKKKIQKRFSVSEIIASEDVAINFIY